MTSKIQVVLFAMVASLGLIRGMTIDEQILESMTSSGHSPSSTYSASNPTPMEYDIVPTAEQASQWYSGSRKKRNAITNLAKRWPSAIVPYAIRPSNFDGAQTTNILNAIADWEMYTCLQFPTRTTESDYIDVFKGNSGCQSYVGYITGAQLLWLGGSCANSLSVIVHEFGHAIGLLHEQNRPDRDTFVTINTANIDPDFLSQFQISSSSSVSAYGTPYDYRSVMHYGRTFFSTNGLDTIVTTDPAFQSIIGNAPTLSYNDAEIVSTMYNCAARCPSTTCSEGYVGPPPSCKCYCSSNGGRNIIECSDPSTTTGSATTTTDAETTTTTDATTTTAADPTTTTESDTTTTITETTTATEATTTTTDDASTTTGPGTETTTMDSETTTTTTETGTTPFDNPCEDTRPEQWCRRRLRRCRRNERVQRRCRLTCGLCTPTPREETCVDQLPSSVCGLFSSQCSESQIVRSVCAASCGTCTGTETVGTCTNNFSLMVCTTIKNNGWCRFFQQNCQGSCGCSTT